MINDTSYNSYQFGGEQFRSIPQSFDDGIRNRTHVVRAYVDNNVTAEFVISNPIALKTTVGTCFLYALPIFQSLGDHYAGGGGRVVFTKLSTGK